MSDQDKNVSAALPATVARLRKMPKDESLTSGADTVVTSVKGSLVAPPDSLDEEPDVDDIDAERIAFAKSIRDALGPQSEARSVDIDLGEFPPDQAHVPTTAPTANEPDNFETGTVVRVNIPEEDIEKYDRESPEFQAMIRSFRTRLHEVAPGVVEKRRALAKNELKKLKKTPKRTAKQEQRRKLLSEAIGRLRAVYKDIEPIGSGAFGNVYKARDAVTGVPVALKLMNVQEVSNEMALRLEREAQTIIGLGHQDGILQGFHLRKLGKDGIPGVEDSGDKFLIETEWIDGADLSTISIDFKFRIDALKGKIADVISGTRKEPIQRKEIPLESNLFTSTKPDLKILKEFVLPEAEVTFESLSDEDILSPEDARQVLDILIQIKNRAITKLISDASGAMARAHDSGIIHRDLKPANIMIETGGRLKIIDWGLAKDLQKQDELHVVFEDPSQKQLGMLESQKQLEVIETQKGDVVGTPVYMSPEQITGKSLTPATDIWSMGMVLMELLTGELPFKEGSFAAVISKIASYDTKDLMRIEKMLPPKLRPIVEIALAWDPNDRLPSMKAFREALDQYLQETTITDKAKKNLTK